MASHQHSCRERKSEQMTQLNEQKGLQPQQSKKEQLEMTYTHSHSHSHSHSHTHTRPLMREPNKPATNSTKRNDLMTSFLYCISLRKGSFVVGGSDIIFGFLVVVYGYLSLTEHDIPKSNDDVMAKLTGIVFILLGCMFISFCIIMIVGLILNRSGLVYPYIAVISLMTGCTGVLTCTTAIAIHTDKKQSNRIAYYMYLGTAIGIAIHWYFIKAVKSYYRKMKQESVLIINTSET
ncbi:hypothetical protein C0J52_17754 [Blattella germanica]|nr:hypothetical protein C0J52_17754 [Blattella germanica]PSN33049.1 hypothetical protein C0J52_17754 [Blattella germanica]